jgi:hypothetical protein
MSQMVRFDKNLAVWMKVREREREEMEGKRTNVVEG